jgi:hypothetical protein
MKIKKIKEAAMMLLCAMLVMSVSSCHDDDDDNTTLATKDEKTEETDESGNEDVGQFVITNISSGEIVEGDETYVVPGDTLTFVFMPNVKYKDVTFQIKKTDWGEDIKDTLVFYSTSIKTTINDAETEPRHRIELSAKSDNADVEISRTIDVFFYDKSSQAVCSVYAMADLLMFVEPVLKFSDNKGNRIDCRPFEGVTIKRDSVDYGWGKIEKTNIWSKAFRYTQWGGSEAEATLSFVKKQPVELTRESYELACSLNLDGNAFEKNLSPLSMSLTINLEITVGGKNKMTDEYGKIKKEYVEEYINKLIETTQTKRIKIDENGKVTEILN